MDNVRPNNGNQITIIRFNGEQTVSMGELKRLILERKVKRQTKCRIGANVGCAQDIRGLEPYFQRAEGPSILPKNAAQDDEPAPVRRRPKRRKPDRPALNIPSSFIALICVAIVFGSVVTFRHMEQARKTKAADVQQKFRQDLVDSVMRSYDNPEEGETFSQTINGLVIHCRAPRDASASVKKEMETRRKHLRKVYATAVRFDQAEREGKDVFTASNGMQYETSRAGLELAVTDVVVGDD